MGVRCEDCAAARGRRHQRRQLLLGFLALLVVRSSPLRAAPDKAVATLKELAQLWSAVKFIMPDVDGDDQPSIVVRLPGGGFYASSLICPHNKCEIMFVNDPVTARNSFDLDVGAPVLACPCHFSAFDPARDGKVIAGPAPNPPLQFKVEVRAGEVFVSR